MLHWSTEAAMRAVRAAVVVAGLFAFTLEVIGNLQMATFAAFGGFATLVLASFAGSRRDKLVAHTALAITGSVLLIIGTAINGVGGAGRGGGGAGQRDRVARVVHGEDRRHGPRPADDLRRRGRRRELLGAAATVLRDSATLLADGGATPDLDRIERARSGSMSRLAE